MINGNPADTVKRCQYIAADPGADDACKCRRPAMPGSSYCEAHAKICRKHQDEMEDAT